MPNEVTKCLIALGGNTGSVERTFELALTKLEQADCVVASRSRSHRSVPMGADAGDPFLNAVACVNTPLPPLDLLHLLQQIEDECGRVRTVHWGPRSLDLDLLCYGEHVLQSPTLTVPHPGMWYRRFVLEPLLEVAADWVHPTTGHTMAELHARLQRRPLVVEFDGVNALPTVPDHLIGRALAVHAGGVMSVASDDAPFCRFTVGAENDHQETVPLSAFELSVRPSDVGAMFEALLAAALGE